MGRGECKEVSAPKASIRHIRFAFSHLLSRMSICMVDEFRAKFSPLAMQQEDLIFFSVAPEVFSSAFSVKPLSSALR
jgi:hypothetical protein